MNPIEPTEEELIYDWNTQGLPPLPITPPLLVDHTLSASVLSQSVTRPELAEQVAMLAGLERLGIHDFCLGSLGDPHTRVLRSAVSARGGTLPAGPSAGRYWVEQPNMDALPAETSCYISQRQKSWAERLKKFGGQATVVVHDVMRCQPQQLHRLLKSAVERNVLGFCLNDDTGRAIPAGTARVVGFAREVLSRLGSRARLEWSGRNDRSMALANALTAWRSGANVLHCSFFGVGEGTGLVASEQLLVNLSLLGVLRRDLSALKEVSALISRGLTAEIYPNQPIVGADAFRTGTGVHAAAIIKAQQKGHDWLADLVYSGVPAARFGFRQIIEIGPMAGASNAHHWLKAHGYEPRAETVNRLLERAKSSERVLTDAEILETLGPVVIQS